MDKFKFPDTSSIAEFPIFKNLDQAISHVQLIIEKRFSVIPGNNNIRYEYKTSLEQKRCKDLSQNNYYGETLISFGFYPEKSVVIFLFASIKHDETGVEHEFRIDSMFFNQFLDPPKWCLNQTDLNIEASNNNPIPVDLLLWSGVSNFPF